MLMKSFKTLVISTFTVVMLCLSFSSMANDDSNKATRVMPSTTAETEMSRLAGDEFYQKVQDGKKGYTTSLSMEHDVLVSHPSETWYILKEKWMSPLGAIAVLGSLAMVTLAYFIVGPLKLSAPRTGRKIKRWSRIDRALHWSMAFTFLSLAISGMTLVWGKHFLKPVISTDAWGDIVYAAKQFHNYVGPIFFILLGAVLIKWWRKSTFKKIDLQWCLKLGGMVGPHKGTHPSAEFSNAGEKIIFWMLITCGFIAAISGFVLDFPIFGQGRRDMDVSNLAHMISALILICGFIFHIYIGLFGMEGALEGMVKGEVDETWAKEHHDIWYAEMKAQGEVEEPEQSDPKSQETADNAKS
ncbi:formate dehydrogenase subunit gamma [Vibrio sp. S11_S32]|uniref:formate dehydrogenase subunit gamma n=1 Tax=Vibrio sp. S11_S32 TaxID=2720225 RepID=UPI0016811814|nr:formate dehydrogenase subunit gamma [Vibrio sp. S11_S32]MBD1575581.1 formate dehydrogenase subunit gamma [Vibrio sp. S11_S32]